jgi:predicted DNA-binding transcriptional regulator AlpA
MKELPDNGPIRILVLGLVRKRELKLHGSCYDPDEVRRVLREQNWCPTPPEEGLLCFSEIALKTGISKGRLYRMAKKKMFPTSLRVKNGMVLHARLDDVRRALTCRGR